MAWFDGRYCGCNPQDEGPIPSQASTLCGPEAQQRLLSAVLARFDTWAEHQHVPFV